MELLKRHYLWCATILIGLILFLSFFIVAETEYVLVTQFGDPVGVHKTSGLKFKWPFQSITRLDKRLKLYNPRPSEHLTADKKSLLIEIYVVWGIEEPLKFIRAVGDMTRAEMSFHEIVWSRVSAAIGQTELSELVSTDPGLIGIEGLMDPVTKDCREVTRDRFGIHIAEVDIKRINLPAQNKDSVFARMRAERERIAMRYRAEGEEEAQKIRATADRDAEKIISEAYREAEVIRGEGDALATQIYGEAFSRDPEFYQLTRTLETYRKILDDKTTAVLSADSELLKLLTRGKNGRLVP